MRPTVRLAFLNRALCAALALLVHRGAATSLAEDSPGPAVPPGQTEQETAESLFAEADSLRQSLPKEVLLGRPAAAARDQKLIARVHTFRQRLERFTWDGQTRDLGAENIRRWAEAAETSFQLSVMLEWHGPAECRAGVVNWWQMLAKLQSTEVREEASRLSLQIADLVIWGSISADPKGAAELIDMTEAYLKPAEQPKLKSTWDWNRPDYEISLYKRAKRSPGPEMDRMLERVSSKLNAYLQDETIPLQNRTHVIARYGSALYNENEVQAAATLMDEWARKHGACVTADVAWLFARFFIAQIGTGDQQEAYRIFQLTARLVAEGKLDSGDDRFRAMSQSFYRFLPMPRLEHRWTTQSIAADHQKRIAPTARQSP